MHSWNNAASIGTYTSNRTLKIIYRQMLCTTMEKTHGGGCGDAKQKTWKDTKLQMPLMPTTTTHPILMFRLWSETFRAIMEQSCFNMNRHRSCSLLKHFNLTFLWFPHPDPLPRMAAPSPYRDASISLSWESRTLILLPSMAASDPCWDAPILDFLRIPHLAPDA